VVCLGKSSSDFTIEGGLKNFRNSAEVYATARKPMPFIIVSPVILTNGGGDDQRNLTGISLRVRGLRPDSLLQFFAPIRKIPLSGTGTDKPSWIGSVP